MPEVKDKIFLNGVYLKLRKHRVNDIMTALWMLK